MNHSERTNQRVIEIGQEIFECADAARPRVWQESWWLERMTAYVDSDENLRTRAFQFVDCLPALNNHETIFRHIGEYFDPKTVSLPKIAHAMLRPGALQRWREDLVGWGARFGATQMAGRFITGYDAPSVIKTIERLRRGGMAFTLDVLGESTTSYAQADRYIAVYHDLIDQLADVVNAWEPIPILDEDGDGPMPRLNLSIKLTSLDPYFDAIDPERSIHEVGSRLRPLMRRARETGALLNIDMESTKHRHITLELFKRLLLEDEFRDWTDVGIVVQAYLTDGERDLDGLLDWGRKRGHRFAIRLVKGAYWDAETAMAVRNYKKPPVWTRKWESDACYERMTRVMLEHPDLIRPAFASHNVRSLSVIIAVARELGLSPKDYELQMLYGMGDPLKAAMVQTGQCLRVYCPYGDLMPGMGYLIRRLLENTSNDGFLKQSFSDRAGRDRLLVDPAVAQPPSGELPTRHYQNTDPEEPMSKFKNASHTSFASAANRQKMLGAIEYVRGEFGQAYPLVIGGEQVTGDAWYESVNPARPTEVVGKIAQATTDEANRAVAAARVAFDTWRMTSAVERAELLRKAAQRMEARRFELAATAVLECGKPWREADADVTEAIDHTRYYAEQIVLINEQPRLRNLPGEDNMMAFSPKGVSVVISPWAFPYALLTGMMTASLAAGNTVVVKPARPASVSAAKLIDTLLDVGFPSGVLNFLPGDGATIGPHLVEHEDVNIVAFTGSEEAGSAVIRAGSAVHPGQAFIKKVIVEMGGKNAIIVDDDADVDGAIQAVIESAFSYAGQKCSSCSRLIVLDGIYDSLLNRLREAAESVSIGPAEAPATMVGPVIDEASRQRVREYIEAGKNDGRLLSAGELPAGCEDGFFVAPHIFVDVPQDSKVAQDEVLGPVLCVFRAKDFDEAIVLANQTRYALTGGVFSRSPSHIDRARREFACGNLYINRKITGSQVDSQPFGGYKFSGTGVKAGSPEYLTHFMDARCVTENTLRSGFVPQKAHSNISE